jgi:Fe2+ transport system protein B
MSISTSRISPQGTPQSSQTEQERQRRIHELADRMATRFAESVVNHYETRPKTLMDRVNEIVASILIGMFMTVALPFYLLYTLLAYTVGNTTIRMLQRE